MLFRSPDVVVEPVTEPLGSLATERPAVIVEILSPSTTGTDLNTKPGEYLSIPTLCAYIVAGQDEAAMLLWERGADGCFGDQGREVSGLDSQITITGRGLAITLRLADIYRGIIDQAANA